MLLCPISSNIHASVFIKQSIKKLFVYLSFNSCREYILVWYFHLFVCWVYITWLSLIDRPCVGVKEEPAEEESWYCSKCMGRSKKPAKRGRGRGRGRGPGRGKKKMMWSLVSQTEASARKEKIIVWNFVSENRGKMEKENGKRKVMWTFNSENETQQREITNLCELLCQRTRLSKGERNKYNVNSCVRE